jgi:hypothetical protein
MINYHTLEGTMFKTSQRRAAFLWRRKLGSCPHCIRKVFQLAVGTWVTLAVLVLVSGWSSVLPAIAMIALGLTALWIAHLVAHATRVTLAVKSRESITERGKAKAMISSRRELWPLFVRALLRPPPYQQ